MLRFKSQEKPMFMGVVTEPTSISTRARGETDTNPSRRASRRKGCWKGWERLKHFPAASPGANGAVIDTRGRLRKHICDGGMVWREGRVGCIPIVLNALFFHALA